MKINWEGIKELEKSLKDNANLDDVKRVVQTNGDRLNREMKNKAGAAFVKGYSHGDTAGSINTTIVNGGMTAEVGPSTEYAPYVEWGTRFMDAEPFVSPAYNIVKQKFISDMEKLMK